MYNNIPTAALIVYLNFIGPQTLQHVASALVLWRLDYCNAVLAGLPASTLAPLQRVQNAIAKLVAGLGPGDHVAPDQLLEISTGCQSSKGFNKSCVFLHTQTPYSTSTV